MADRSSGSVGSWTVGAFLDAVADEVPVPGGGAVAGTVTALAAALAEMAGRYARGHAADPAELAGLVARSRALRARAGRLADEDAAAYQRYVEASRLPKEPDAEARRAAVRAALDAAADVPAALAAVATQVVEVAAELAASGNPRLRSDACTAALLAAATARSAALLVRENLRAHPDDPRTAAAERNTVWAASLAADLVAPSHHLPDRTTS
ncbi:cyclodeaminase/cyclohydrolase family protein [Streptomyces sp. NPDC056161]|uniref:cyclodeaminase/cyclohydrolase family protein n=1 Tax=Streptomyces sp. NPDC056161 TaxID=3345732 RepID=UPI0035E09B9F